MKQIRKKYCWKKLSQDGLLQDPPNFGAYYETRNLNVYNGFDTEEEAIATFIEFNELYEYEFRDDYTLIIIYSVTDHDFQPLKEPDYLW
jgi:hypothetical protein